MKFFRTPYLLPLAALAAWLCLDLAPASAQDAAKDRADTHLRLATTTSVEHSGLLTVLLPPFEADCRCKVDVIATGTGRALAVARRGDVDVVLVHAPALEKQFITNGYGTRRIGIMENDFLLVGPADDPAGIAHGKNAARAFARIAAHKALFISRGDNSGTHIKERSVWQDAGIDPHGTWYRKVGQGMGHTLIMAGEIHAHTLIDRGTWLALMHQVDLIPLVEGDPLLLNPYHLIPVNPKRHPQVRHALAMQFADWLTSHTGQTLIGEYRVAGQPLFRPVNRSFTPN